MTEYIPMSSPDSFLCKIPLRAFLSQLYIKPWLHKIIIFDEIRKYYGKHKNDNHWVKLQYSRDKNIVLLSRKHKNDIHRVKLQNDNALGSIIMTAILSNRILFIYYASLPFPEYVLIMIRVHFCYSWFLFITCQTVLEVYLNRLNLDNMSTQFVDSNNDLKPYKIFYMYAITISNVLSY